MARIPSYTRKVFLNRAGASSVSAARAAGGGNEAQGFRQDAAQAQRTSDTAGRIGNQFAAQKKADGVVRAQERFNQHKREILPQWQEQRNKSQEDPGGFADNFDKFYREQSSLVEDELKLGSDGKNFDLDHFRQLTDRDRTSTYEKSFTFENSQRVQNTFTNVEKGMDDMIVTHNASDPGFQEAADFQKEIAAYAKTVGGVTLSPQDMIKLTEFGTDNASKSFLFNQLQNDPTALRRVLDYGQGGKDPLTDFIMEDIEGGAKIAHEPGGAIAKYGINSQAYADRHGITPEAAKKTVAGLSQEDAAEELKKYYYDERLDEFDAQFQAVAYDALVNHGTGKSTWEMIDEADGDPYALILARQDEYARLADANPEKYNQYVEGWDGRMNKLTEYVQTLENGGTAFLENSVMVDSQILSNARSKIPQALDDKKKTEAIELANANTASVYEIKANEDELNKLIYDDTVQHEIKIQALREADFKGLIGDKFATEAERLLGGKKALKKVEHDPQAIADMYTRKERLFNKSNKDGKRRVTVSEGMLDDIGDMMVEAMAKGQTGEMTPSESKAMAKSLGMDLAAAGDRIGKGFWFPDFNHDELAFKFFADSTDRPDHRNELFRRYTEASTDLDAMTEEGLPKDEIEKQGKKIAMDVKTKWIKENVSGAASLDKMPNNVMTVDGNRIFVGAHADTPAADAGVNADRKAVKYKGRDAWQYPDGSLEYME